MQSKDFDAGGSRIEHRKTRKKTKKFCAFSVFRVQKEKKTRRLINIEFREFYEFFMVLDVGLIRSGLPECTRCACADSPSSDRQHEQSKCIRVIQKKTESFKPMIDHSIRLIREIRCYNAIGCMVNQHRYSECFSGISLLMSNEKSS